MRDNKKHLKDKKGGNNTVFYSINFYNSQKSETRGQYNNQCDRNSAWKYELDWQSHETPNSPFQFLQSSFSTHESGIHEPIYVNGMYIKKRAKQTFYIHSRKWGSALQHKAKCQTVPKRNILTSDFQRWTLWIISPVKWRATERLKLI